MVRCNSCGGEVLEGQTYYQGKHQSEGDCFKHHFMEYGRRKSQDDETEVLWKKLLNYFWGVDEAKGESQ